MPRFRFFSKKRGQRRTMSELGGQAAMAAFFAVLMVAGSGILAIVVGQMTAPEWRANHEFLETQGTVLGKRIAEISKEDQLNYRPEVSIRYAVEGREYEATTFDATGVYSTDRAECERLIEPFEVGKEYPCWYDPHRPSTAVVKRGYSWVAWVLPLLPAAFVAVGVGGLIYVFLTWGKSAEHRALLQQASNMELFEGAGGSSSRYPTVPADQDITNSPGTTLKHRLPIAAPGWNTWFMTIVAIGWNILVGWLVYKAIDEALAGRADYLLGLGLIPFLVAGGFLAFLAGKQLMITTGVEPTVVEVSDHPLYPGGRYEIFFSQQGRLHFERLSIVLACDEEATFRQGTNSRTHIQRVVETEVFRRDSFTLKRGQPFATRLELRVPEAAMHSFQSPHNAVKWKLIVRGDLHNWPDFERVFSLLVFPGRNGVPHA
ncbi:MAG: DUF3592 domain-containing protein [Planctomycetia bacterium]|nr:DUF3592 domain-containing protein [Planctomycetia bacterium]